MSEQEQKELKESLMIIDEKMLRAIIRSSLVKEIGFRGTGAKVGQQETTKEIDPSKGGDDQGFDDSPGATFRNFEFGTSKDKKISSRVQWGSGTDGAIREKVWNFLSTFLPAKSTLTSCFRSQDDQNRIIKMYALKKGYIGNQADFDAMHKFATDNGIVVARNVGKGHGGAQGISAFDISGADLDNIWAGVQKANEDDSGVIKFQQLEKGGSIIERNNNAVHVQFAISDFDQDAYDRWSQGKVGDAIADRPGESDSA